MSTRAWTKGLSVCALLLLSAAHVQAQDKSHQDKSHQDKSHQDKSHQASAVHKPAPAARKAAASASTKAASAAPVKSTAAATVAASKGNAPAAPHTTPSSMDRIGSDDPGDVRKEGDTQVKTLEFTGLDIEGQLKTPQMLYFLNRLRAEFGRPRLPHRSFMPELQRGTQEKAF